MAGTYFAMAEEEAWPTSWPTVDSVRGGFLGDVVLVVVPSVKYHGAHLAVVS